MTVVLLCIGIILLIPLLGGVRGGSSFAQSTAVTDSLLQVLQTTTYDTTRIKTLNILAWKLKFNNPDTAILLSQQSLELCEKTLPLFLGKDARKAEGVKKYTAQSHHNLGEIYRLKGNYSLALSCNFKALKIREQLKDKESIALSLGNIGSVYLSKGDYPKALEYYLKVLKTFEEIGDKKRIAIVLRNIGIIYFNQGDYPKALEYYFKALKINEEIDDKSGIAAGLSNIGIVYWNQGDYPKALEYYFKALKISEELGYQSYIAVILGNIGNVYEEQGDYSKALEHYLKALKISEELGNKSHIAAWLSNIGSLYIRQKNYPKAERCLLQALEIADNIGVLNYKMQIENSISELYAKWAEASDRSKRPDAYKKAYEHYKEYSIAKDSIYNEEKSKEIGKLEAGFEYDKKLALEQAQHEKQAAVAASESKRQKVVIYAVSGGLLLLIVFFVLLFNRFRIIRKQKEIIEEQKQVVDEKNVEITQKNKDITDSIRYAENIQKAILPPIEEIKKALPESFVLFKPKDIVSGDFYFFAQVNQYTIIAACDCTGHGVPGAFMSMIGNSLLNEIVNDRSVTKAAEVLDQLRDGIIHAFGEAGATGEQKDGMDMALCIFQSNKNNGIVNLQYAGAYNPLYIVRAVIPTPPNEIVILNEAQRSEEPPTSGTYQPEEGSFLHVQDSASPGKALEKGARNDYELTVVKSDKRPVGFYPGEQKPFTNNEIELRKGDTIYIFSDGYQDQFGGPRGKKFMSKRFRQLFLDIQKMSMEEQKEHLDKTIEDWKEGREQVDDILVIGVKV